MKSIKLSLIAALMAGSSLAADIVSDVEVSANVALTSNYVWRGMTQSGDSPAVQGGVDLGYNGFYAGVWGSAIESTKASSEFDIYVGYANEIGKFSYDVGFIEYMYPNDTDALNFGEAYLSLGYDFDVVAVSGMYYIGVDTHDVAGETAATAYEPGDGWELGVSVPLPMDVSLDGTYGSYDDAQTSNSNVNSYGEYYSVSVSKSFGKFDVSLAYTGMDYEAAGTKSQDNVVATISTSF